MGSSIVIFTRPDCDLCREVGSLLQARGHQLAFRDITADRSLVQAYGHCIPVLRDAAGRELAFPFDEVMMDNWLQAVS